jgi:hypothetical protein
VETNPTTAGNAEITPDALAIFARNPLRLFEERRGRSRYFDMALV